MAAFLRTTAVGAPNSTAVASSTIVVPSDAVAGDYARIVVASTASAATLTTPTGWSVLAGPTLQASNFVMYILGKQLVAADVDTGSGVGATVTLAFTGGTGRITSQMNVYGGVSATGITVSTAVIESSADTSTVLPTIASVAAGAAFDVAFIGRVSSGVAPDLTLPAGYSQGTNARHETTSGSSNLSSEGIYKIASSGGAYGGESATTSGGLSVAYAIAIPASGGSPAAPVAGFTATPTTGTAPLTVQFTDQSTNTPTSWAWDFGDSTSSTTQNPSKTYTTAGTYTVTLTATNATGSDSEIKTGYITVGSAAIPDTPTLLARANKVTPTGAFTTEWAQASPVADTTFDLRSAEFQGFFWADAIFGFGTYSNGSGGTTATPHELNRTPINIGESGRTTRGAIIGGKIIGDQPTTLTWNSMKHGSHIQQALDSGQTGSEAWALIVNNQNQDGDPRIKVAEGSWAVVDGLRAYNTHDGLGIYSQTDSLADTGSVTVRNLWIRFNHDDAIENDRAYLTLTVEDSLFEDIHCLLSVSGASTPATPDPTKVQTIRNSVIKLKPKPGPYQQPTSVLGHGPIYKDTGNSPPLVMENCIIGAEKFASASQADFPTGPGCSYTNVTVVWLGTGAWPGNVPAGVTVTTDASVLTNAIDRWKGRHGVTDFNTVNMATMIAPLADPPSLPGLIDGVEPEAHGHVPPFCDSNGNLYRVTEEYGAPVEPHNTPKMMKSIDGGMTWAEVDAVNRPSDNDLESGWMIQSGTTLYYIYTDGGFVSFNSFNTSDAPTNPDKWVIKNEKGITGLSGGSQQHASAVRLSDGRFRAFFSDTQAAGPNRQLAFITRAAAGGWSAKTRMTVDTDNHAGAVACVGASDKTHIFYHNYGGKQVLYRTLTSADVLSTAVRADTTGTNTTARNYNAVSNPVYYNASGTEVVTALFASASGLRAITVTGGVVGAEQVVDSTGVLVSPANTDGNTGNDGPVCHLSVNGTTLYAIWADTNGDLYWSKRDHGGAWTARAMLWDAPSGRTANWTYGNVYTRAGKTVLGYTYDDGPHPDNDSNIYYNEMTLAASAVTGLVYDVWNGSALIRRRIDRWSGTQLVQILSE